jgi:hypothetical protein
MKRQTKTTERKNDHVYFRDLNALVDELFKIAAKQHWTWEQMADRSGVSRQTIFKLGMGDTRYPQLRTVGLLAYALGGRLIYNKKPISKVMTLSQRQTFILKMIPKKRKLKLKKVG